MKRLGKKKAVTAAILLVAIIGVVATIVIVQRSGKKVANTPAVSEGSQNLQDVVNQVNQQQQETILGGSEAVKLQQLVKDKKFDEAIAMGEKLCATLADYAQAACFSSYINALLEKNMLDVVTAMCPAILKNSYIASNETALKNWKFICDNAGNGINPKSVYKTESYEEAIQ